MRVPDPILLKSINNNLSSRESIIFSRTVNLSSFSWHGYRYEMMTYPEFIIKLHMLWFLIFAQENLIPKVLLMVRLLSKLHSVNLVLLYLCNPLMTL